MAPGCFSQSAKESTNTTETTNNNNNNTKLASTIVAELIQETTTNEIVMMNSSQSDTNNANNSKETPESPLTETSSSGLCENYAGDMIIHLDQIPLPPGPLPPRQHDANDDDQSDSDEEEEDEEMGNHLVLKNTCTTTPTPRVTMKRRVNPTPHFVKFVDTVDSFEVLEQTIIKQKRLAKLKNTDLRRKVLLKRTFDLVCEIMDSENGFNEDDAAASDDMDDQIVKSVLAKVMSAPASSSAKVVVEEEDDDEEEENDEDEDESSSGSGLELELHDHTKMLSDDDDDEDDDDDDEPQPEVHHVTVVKLDVESSANVVAPSTCQVPRHHHNHHLNVKRRSSSDDDEEDEEDADDDDDDYEYSMVHFNDQQLNYRRGAAAYTATVESSDERLTTMYISSHTDAKFHRQHTIRSNHPRKRVKI